MSYRVLMGLLLAVAVAGDAFAQEVGVVQETVEVHDVLPRYIHTRWTAEDGLPVNSVIDVLQSSDGYLWFATLDGLVRFDGFRFTVFSGSTFAGLLSNRIVHLSEDARGDLWLRTEQRFLVRFDRSRRAFIPFKDATGQPSSKITCLYEDADGTMWIGAGERLIRYRSGVYRGVGRLPDGAQCRAIMQDRTGALWIGTTKGLVRRQDGDVSIFTVQDGLPARAVTVLQEGQDGVVWIGTMRGVACYRGGELKRPPQPKALRGARVYDLHASPSGRLWVMTEDKVWGFKQHRSGALSAQVEHATYGNPGQVLLGPSGRRWVALENRLYLNGHFIFETASLITDLHLDHEGGLWVSTGADGIFRFERTPLHYAGKESGLASANAYPVYESPSRPGRMWIGTAGGLYRIRNRAVQYYPTNGSVLAAVEDTAGTLWVWKDRQLHRFAGGHFRELNRPAPFRGERGKALFVARDGALWLGTDEGTYRRGAAGGWTHYDTGDGLPHNSARVFYQTRDGVLWVGTAGGGIAKYVNDGFVAFSKQDGLSSNLIRSFYEDEAGYLWIGTENRGLCRLTRHPPDLADAVAACIQKGDGLFDDVIHQILEDAQGRLWMSTNRGIFWVRREAVNAFFRGTRSSVQSVSYTERDGMHSREANGGVQAAGVEASDGRLWFPTQEGVVVIDPRQVHRNPVPPRMHIEALRAADAAWRAPAGVLHLSERQRDVEIQYTALSFSNPKGVQFRYRLRGHDQRWTEAGARRTAYYTNLPPGTYTFEVEAANGDGVWTHKAARLTFSIAPYFYETTWFLLLGLLAAAGAVTAGFAWQARARRRQEEELTTTVASRTKDLKQALHTVERQAERLEEMGEAKNRFFTNISHEFRTPLTLIIGPLQQAMSRSRTDRPPRLEGESVALMHRNSLRLQRLSNHLLELARLDANRLTLDARPGNLKAFAQRTARAFAPLAERRHVDLTGPSDAFALYCRFDPEKMETVLVNLLSNAFKFTPKGGAVTMALTQENNDALLVVRDTGTGIPRDKLPYIFDRFYQVDGSVTRLQEGTGIGLALARELVELHGGRISVESEKGKGTTFTIRLACLGTGARGRGRERESGRAGEREQVVRPPLHTSTPPYSKAAVHDDENGQDDTDAKGSDEDQPTVLLIDDNADLRAYVQSILAPRYRVMEASDGRQGLERCRATLPDVIIADVMMPRMDGLTLSRALKEDIETAGIPVLVLTARATTGDRIAGLTAGADDYMTKPFDAGVLLSRVDNLIAGRQRLREVLRHEWNAQSDAASAERVPAPGPFEARVRECLQEHYTDPDYALDDLASALAMSRSQLYRRLRSEADTSPSALLRRFRLERAVALLDDGRYINISEVAYGVGFNSLSYFSRCFRSQFNCSPSEYAAGEAMSDE